jgi:hypothetical protein
MHAIAFFNVFHWSYFPYCLVSDNPSPRLFTEIQIMNYPAPEQRDIICHAGLDPASSLDFWIPAFAGMTPRRKRRGLKPYVIKL